MTYLGFKNRETWAVYHWIVSDPDHLRAFTELINVCPDSMLDFTLMAAVRLIYVENPYIGADIGDLTVVDAREVANKIKARGAPKQ